MVSKNDISEKDCVQRTCIILEILGFKINSVWSM